MFKNIREEQKQANERKLLEAKLQDKYQFAISKNKITNTDFLNLMEKSVAEKFLKEKGISNYLFFGGNREHFDRVILLFYPKKFSKEMVEKNVLNIVSAIRIRLPKNLQYEHRNYLSGMMKLGIRREKIGDILVQKNGADILVLKEVAEFLETHLKELTRFQKAKVTIISAEDVIPIEKKFEEFDIIVSSMRLDNFVAELVRCSRSKALEWINEQRVFVNDVLETKFSKRISVGDVITIRRKGKFIVVEKKDKTKSEKDRISMKKFC